MSHAQSELEQQVSQALQERHALELKLAQAERNAQHSLAAAQHTYQEQLEAEHKDKVSLIFIYIYIRPIMTLDNAPIIHFYYCTWAHFRKH